MKFLRCLNCDGQLEIIAEEGIDKIVQCCSCEQPTIYEKPKRKEPEVVIRRKITK